MFAQNYHQSSTPTPLNRLSVLEDLPRKIDQFIKKEIDLGAGIDFYRVVEEFENRLISEALRRTNHNKNRAAQLLSMNRTTLVEKLKKRASSSSIKAEGNKVKRNSAFTIFGGLIHQKIPSDFHKFRKRSIHRKSIGKIDPNIVQSCIKYSYADISISG